MTELWIEPFANVHPDGLVVLVLAEGRSAYAVDVEWASRAMSAPAVTTLVATEDGRVVGAIHVQSDGVIQAAVSMLSVDRDWRGHHLGFRLLREGLGRAGGLRLDIPTRRARVTSSGLARAARSTFASCASTSGPERPSLWRGKAYRR